MTSAKGDKVQTVARRKLRVWRTFDGGESWQEFRADLPQKNCLDLAIRSCLEKAGYCLVFGTAFRSLFFSEDPEVNPGNPSKTTCRPSNLCDSLRLKALTVTDSRHQAIFRQLS